VNKPASISTPAVLSCPGSVARKLLREAACDLPISRALREGHSDKGLAVDRVQGRWDESAFSIASKRAVRRRSGELCGSLSEAGPVLDQEPLRSPTTSPTVSHLTPAPRSQDFARIRPDVASAIGQKTDPFKVAPRSRPQPKDVTTSDMGHFDVALSSGSRGAIAIEREEKDGAQSSSAPRWFGEERERTIAGLSSPRNGLVQISQATFSIRGSKAERLSITKIGGYRSKRYRLSYRPVPRGDAGGICAIARTPLVGSTNDDGEAVKVHATIRLDSALENVPRCALDLAVSQGLASRLSYPRRSHASRPSAPSEQGGTQTRRYAS
jgi:hypothetical protein